MIYVGMDVSSKNFQIYAQDRRKKKVFEGAIEPSRKALKEMLKELGSETKLVVFEAGNQMKWIALQLKKMKDVQVHVVHPNEVKWITASNGKTDKVDARKLSDLGRGDMLPRAVHIVEGEVRELRELMSARDQLLRKRVSLVNTLRGFIKQEGYSFPAKFFSRKNYKKDLKKIPLADVQKEIILRFMDAVEAIKKAEEELAKKLMAIKDSRIELIESVPGIGKLGSRILLGAIDNAKRFDNKKCIANYGALTPTIYQSGSTENRGKINRDGRHEMRKLLLQSAHAVTRMKAAEAKPLQDFFHRIEKRRGKKRALVALARKILTTVYGVMKRGEYYDPRELAPAAA